MEATSVLLHSKAVPFGFSFNRKSNPNSLRHLNKQVIFHRPQALEFQTRWWVHCQPNTSYPYLSVERGRKNLLVPLKCSLSSTSVPEPQNPFVKPFKSISLDSLKTGLAQLTPMDVVKLSGVLSVAIASTRWSVNLLLNPFFWTYFSWTWLFWPWFVAIAISIYGLYSLRKHLRGEANMFEQLAIITSAFAWLTLFPPAYFNGYLEGWPFVFFFVYHYFFFFSISVRRRMYGDYYARPHDPKWDIEPPRWYRILFCVGIMAGHWLVSVEGPELHRIPGGRVNVAIWILILVALLMQYNSTLYMAKYSEKVVEPKEVVQVGPYRWVRHPIYASTMLLFATYCAALRAPLSMLFIIGVCLLYYGHKAKMEEAVLVETFGENYIKYASKVKYKLIPLVY